MLASDLWSEAGEAMLWDVGSITVAVLVCHCLLILLLPLVWSKFVDVEKVGCSTDPFAA